MKHNLKNQLRDMLIKQSGHFMRISIWQGPGAEPVFYKSIPCDRDVSVNVTSEEAGDSLIRFIDDLEIQASENPKAVLIEYIMPPQTEG